MHESHANEEWDDAEGHDLILPEQAFIAHISACEAEEDDDEREAGAPPTEQQRRVVLAAGARLGRRLAGEVAREYHDGVEHGGSLSPASAEGRCGCRVLWRAWWSQRGEVEGVAGALTMSAEGRADNQAGGTRGQDATGEGAWC